MKHSTFPDGLPYKNLEGVERAARDHLRHYGDTAYIAMGKAVPGLDYTTPFKRRPDKDRTSEQWTCNLVHSRVHIHVEDSI